MILLLFCTQQMIAQKTTVTAPDMPRDETTNLTKYQEVVDMPGTLIPELAKRATNWGKKYFVNWNGLGAVVDTINGKITLKPQFNVYRTLKDGTKAIANVIRYEMTIDLKYSADHLPNPYREVVSLKEVEEFYEKAWKDMGAEYYELD